MDYLYHYTSFCSAIKILCSGKLRFGKFSDLNDIHESFRQVFGETTKKITAKNTDDLKCIEKAEQEIKSYRQISFSTDNNDNNDNNNPGYAIAPMWGHYAEKGNGVCLVFDKGKIIQKLKKMQKLDVSILINFVKYNDNHGEVDLNEFSTERFFEKFKDWSYEREFRIVRKCLDDSKDEYLEFGDALLSVILYGAQDVKPGDSVFNSKNYEILKKIGKPILELGWFFDDVNLRNQNGHSCLPNGKKKEDIFKNIEADPYRPFQIISSK